MPATPEPSRQIGFPREENIHHLPAVISCSPREGGNSDHAAACFSAGIRLAGGDCRVLFLRQFIVHPCTGCLRCSQEPGKECHLSGQDQSDELFRILLAAPLLFLSSPIYFYHLPSQFKCWIDRSQSYYLRRESGDPLLDVLPARTAVIALLAGRHRGERLFEGALLTLKYFLRTFNFTLGDHFPLRDMDAAGDLQTDQQARKVLITAGAAAWESVSRGRLMDVPAPFPVQAARALGRFMTRVFPGLDQRCGICGSCLDCGVLPGGHTRICGACLAALELRTGGFCPRCGLLFALPGEAVSPCLDCRLLPPPWREVYFFGRYEGLLKELVLRFKFQAQIGLTRVLQDLLAATLRSRAAPCFERIVPVPLHPAKLRARGFNQSLELARGIAGFASRGLACQALTRIRDTPAQHTLPRSLRMDNLKGAFLADSDLVRGLSILLVDDILTTGATAKAAAKTLLNAGARDVSLLILARA